MQYRQNAWRNWETSLKRLQGWVVKKCFGLVFFSCGPIIKQTSTIFRLELKMEGVYDDSEKKSN